VHLYCNGSRVPQDHQHSSPRWLATGSPRSPWHDQPLLFWLWYRTCWFVATQQFDQLGDWHVPILLSCFPILMVDLVGHQDDFGAVNVQQLLFPVENADGQSSDY
jgi:hypothetical protein